MLRCKIDATKLRMPECSETPLTSISVVIACRNGSATISACLRAVFASTYPVRECIVVDDCSIDNSAELATSCGAQLIELLTPAGPARARNTGASIGTGDVLIFLDSDVCVHSDTLARIAEHFQNNPELDAVIGSYDDTPGDPGFVSQYRNLLHCFTHQHGRRASSTFWCGCGAIRRSVFLRHGGLPEHYRRPCIEDIEFGYELHVAGATLLLDRAIQVKHLKRWTLANMVRTDVCDRAVPWTRLILRSGQMPDDLNIKWSQRASVALALSTPPLLLAGQYAAVFLLVCVLIGLNCTFYRFLIDKRGVCFGLAAIPLHLSYFLYSGVGFGVGLSAHLFSRGRAFLRELAGEAEA